MPRPDRGLLLDSIAAFALGGLVAEAVDLAGLTFLGSQSGWSPTVSFDSVSFGAAPATGLEWGGGLGALMATTIVLVLVYSGRGPYRTSRLAVLWTLIHLAARGFLQLAAVPLTTDTPAERALAALGWGEFGITLAAIASIVALIGLGTLAGAEFAQFARTDFESGSEVRRYVAWLAGAGTLGGFPLVVGLLWPLQDTSVVLDGLGAAFVAVMGIVFARWYVNVLTKGTPRRMISFGLVVVTAAVAFAIRLYAYQA